MAFLKKIKSATLIEVLVATVLIVVIFMVASLVLNNLLINTISKNTHALQTRINEISYQIQNRQLELPHTETYGDWDIDIKKQREREIGVIVITAVNSESGKQIIKKQYDAE